VKKVQLTIVIPTFNGGRFLEQTVRSACSQVAEHKAVQILVLDNASTDEAPQVLKDLIGLGLDFTLVRNEQTLNADRNFEKAVSLATGEYVWLLADDDVLIPGAISAMIRVIVEEHPEAVVTNFLYVDETLTPIEGHPHQFRVVRGGSYKNPDTVLFSGEDALSEIGFEFVGLVSANCFRRELYLDHSHSVPIPKGFDFMYSVTALMLSGRTAFISTPLVLFRQYRKRWETKSDYSDNLRIDWLIIPAVLAQLKKLGYSSKLINRISFQRSLSFLWHLNQAKAKGFKVSKSFLFNMVSVNKQNFFLLLQLPLFFFSPKVIRALAGIYNSGLGGVVKGVLRIGNPR
jgi:glycosyltransferase involved in cell wall biosynthesis